MPISIQPYRPEHEPAVREFNTRLQAAGDLNLVFYKTSQPVWLPKLHGSALHNEYFVALDGDAVRGAYALKHEIIHVGSEEVAVACYHHPLSEGILNRAYASVGGLMLRDALSRQPLLYALGMGGLDRPLPKMLKALGWSLNVIPFYFKVIRPGRFLSQMEALRTSPLRRILMSLAAISGAGWLGIRAAQIAAQTTAPATNDVSTEQITEFSAWTDSLWQSSRARYGMAAVRDCETLKRLYPTSEQHFTRLRVRRGKDDIGWAVVAERRQDPKFGTMRVSSIVDCWAAPENALAVVRAATRELEAQNFDLIVSNQSHQNWGRALRQCGFFTGPSNFVFAASKRYADALRFPDAGVGTFHINRADGDGLPRNF